MLLFLMLIFGYGCLAFPNYLQYDQHFDYDLEDFDAGYYNPKFLNRQDTKRSPERKWLELYTKKKAIREDKKSSRSTCTRWELCYCYSKMNKRYFCCDCDNGACFPASTIVNSRTRGLITMDQLRINDDVITVSETGHEKFSKVLAFLDRRPKVEAPYLELRTSNNKTLCLSKSHLIFITRLRSKFNHTAVLAKDVMIGDQVLVVGSGNQSPTKMEIIGIESRLMEGAYVPVTLEGTIVVDNILTSCYTSYGHNIAHHLLAPIRWFPTIFETESSQYQPGLRTYAWLLKLLGQIIFPSQNCTDNDDVVTVWRQPKTITMSGNFIELARKVFMFSVTAI